MKILTLKTIQIKHFQINIHLLTILPIAQLNSEHFKIFAVNKPTSSLTLSHTPYTYNKHISRTFRNWSALPQLWSICSHRYLPGSVSKLKRRHFPADLAISLVLDSNRIGKHAKINGHLCWFDCLFACEISYLIDIGDV